MIIDLPESFTVQGWHIWLSARTVVATILSIWEMKRTPSRPIHVDIRRALFHTAVPEWACFKMIAFLPVWLFTGTRFSRFFSPIKTVQPKQNFKCNVCRDRGWIRELRPRKGKKHRSVRVACSCKTSEYWGQVVESYDVSC